MTYTMSLLLIGLVLGLIAVASNPSPYFGALGLVLAAGTGSCMLGLEGASFLCLVLFLIYLGGMLVVFAYTAALASDPYPETWGNRSVATYAVAYAGGVFVTGVVFRDSWCKGLWAPTDGLGDFSVFRGDTGGVALMYSLGGGMLVISAWVLLLTLFVVLELTRGLNRGALRVV